MNRVKGEGGGRGVRRKLQSVSSSGEFDKFILT